LWFQLIPESIIQNKGKINGHITGSAKDSKTAGLPDG
jgi:hypothetical protein